jgi:hypothetical protein
MKVMDVFFNSEMQHIVDRAANIKCNIYYIINFIILHKMTHYYIYPML